MYYPMLKTDGFILHCNYFLNCPWSLGLALSEHGKITAKPKEYCRFFNKKEVKGE